MKIIKILVLRSNPTNTSLLRLDEEVRGIKEELERARYRDRFEFINEGAVRVDDLSRALLQHKPDIVHFSGHGAGEQGLVLEDNAGTIQLVTTEALSSLFKWARNTVKCVFLNACYSQVQAEAIHRNIDCVIGMNQAIGDQSAIKFAAKFYQALLNGEAFQSAYDYACTALDLSGSKESSTPELLNRIEGADPLALAAPSAIQSDKRLQSEPLKPTSEGLTSSSNRNNSFSASGSVTGRAIVSSDNNTIDSSQKHYHSGQVQNNSGVHISDSGNNFQPIQAKGSVTTTNTVNQAPAQNSELESTLKALEQLKQSILNEELSRLKKEESESRINRLQEELKKPDPDKSFIQELTSALEQGLESVAILAKPVATVAALVGKAVAGLPF